MQRILRDAKELVSEVPPGPEANLEHRIHNIPPFTRRVRDERWPRRRRQRAAGGSGDERNSSIILRRFPTHVAVGFAMNRTDWIYMSR